MQNLILVKYEIKQEECSALISIFEELKDEFNVALMPLQRTEDFHIHFLPIFNGTDVQEFDEVGVALDIESSELLQRSPAKHKFYYPLQQELGDTTIPKINNIQEVIDNVKASA